MPHQPAKGAPPQDDTTIIQANRFAWQVLAGAALCLVVVGIVAHYIMASSVLLESGDALENATCARRISRAQGFTTQVIHPLTVGMGHEVGPQPLLSQGPFFPAFLSAYFGLRGESDLTVRLGSALALLVTFAALISLGTRLYGIRIGIAASLLFAVNPYVVESAISGTAYVWASAWFTLALAFALFGAPNTPPVSRRQRITRCVLLALAGLCMGLCYLSTLATLPLAAVLAWMVSQRVAPAERRTAALVFAGAFVLIALPWWIRNVIVAHNPLFALDRYQTFYDTPLFAGSDVLRSLDGPGNPYLYLLVHPGQILGMVARTVADSFAQMPMALGAVFFVLFAAVLVKRDEDTDGKRMRQVVIIGAIATGLLTLNMRFTPHTYLALMPLVALLAVAHLAQLLAVRPRLLRGAAWAGIGVLCMAPVAAKRLTTEPQPMSPLPALMAAVQENTPEDIVLISDVSPLVAWYADRTALGLPLSGVDLDALLERAQGKQLGFFLTPSVVSGGRRSDLTPYRNIVQAETLPEGLREIPLEVPGGRLFVFDTLSPRLGPSQPSNDEAP